MSVSGGNSIYLYTRFERFWHWAQSLFILILLFTGFEIHGTYHLLGFETAFRLHNSTAWAWLTLYVFIIFWMLTTGEWKQYVPTFRKLVDVACYYAYGIFKGESHPVPKCVRAKHNPLQRLTYLSIVTFLVPYQLLTGYLYYYYNRWPELGFTGSLNTVAVLHTIGGFAMLIFVIIHVYMTTTGHTPLAHIMSMISGWEEVEDKKTHDWEAKVKPS